MSRIWASRRKPCGPDTLGHKQMKPVPRCAMLLTIVTVLSAIAAAVTTLVRRDSFPDPSPAPLVNTALAEARGWSTVTLALAVPLTLISLAAAVGGSLRGRLVWIGSLGYFTYTYLEFAVSPPFTPLYLVYIAAFACAIPALVLGVASIDVPVLSAVFGDRTPRRTVAIFSLVFASLLSFVWLREIAGRTIAGNFGWPGGVDAIGHVVHALDLGLQVPLAVGAGVLLLRRRASGYLVAAMMLINAVCMGGALTAMVAWSAAASATSMWTAAIARSATTK